MNNINNFYKLFEILPNASNKEIIMAYENKITKYNNIKKLSNEQINDIKILKIGLHVLITPNLRKKYNKSFNISNKLDKVNSDPIALNSENDDKNTFEKKQSFFPNETTPTKYEFLPQNVSHPDETLESLFNVDNTWMKDININKKNNFDRNIGDRVFSLSNINQRPGFSSDFEAELRKPLQGREDKSTQILNKNKM
jgi:hypothetical protein